MGQLLAAVAAATIPMGIVQASSTMTDAIVAFWVICAVSETLSLQRGGAIAPLVIYSSLAAGLGILDETNSGGLSAALCPAGRFDLLRRVRLGQTARAGRD